MNRLTLTLSGVLLATSALIAPGLAFAQTAPTTSPTAQTPAEQVEKQATEVGEIVVLGRYIPEPNRESSEVAAFLTSEDLERTGDSNAAAALTRIGAAGGVGISVPVFAVAAGGGVIVDVDGNSLIDLGSGIAVTTVGNAAPEVVAAVSAQAASFTHTCFMITGYEGYVAVAETLNRLTPGDHDKRTALFNSGSEAVENAIKIARAHTGRKAVVAFDHAYHGRTNLTMALTAKVHPYKNGFGPFAPEVYRAPLSAAELELMNLTGDGNGLDMVMMPAALRARVPTANFFQQSGYERNPVARRTGVVAGLIARGRSSYNVQLNVYPGLVTLCGIRPGCYLSFGGREKLVFGITFMSLPVSPGFKR